MVEIGFTGFVAFQAAELAMHVIYGIRAVQGGPTHFTVMIAGILGVAIGMRTGRKSDAARARTVRPVAIVPDVPANVDAEVARPDAPLQTLRLGIALPGR